MNCARVVAASLALAPTFAPAVGDVPPPSIALPDDPALRHFVDEALGRNPDLAGSRSTVRADRDRVPQAGALPDPTLTLGIQNDGFQSIQIGKMETSFWQVMLTQPVPWPGKLGARKDVARALAAVAEARLERQRLATTADMERAYIELLLVREQLTLLSDLDALWKEAEAIVRTRYEVGQASQSDLLRAQLERSRLRQRRVALEEQERERVQALNTLRVRPLDESVATSRALAALSPPPLRSAEEVAVDAEARSPDLAIALLSVKAAERSVESAHQDWFPDMSVSAGVMPRGQIEPMWAVQVGFTLPVFGAAKQSKAVDESVSRREAGEREVEATRLLVLLRARERRTSLAATLETIEIYRGGVLVQSDAAVRSTLAQYKVGKVTFASVLEVIRGLVLDEGGYLGALAGVQRIGIADREVSLAPVGVMDTGAAGGAAVPGAGRAGVAAAAASGQAAAATSPGGMPVGM
ncbi:MAG TPA: TolC family protein [Anaeromyxobacteraceae bacterium]|nr:TolC family protein [Anaeromyxobacteraceae bacterium]